MQKNDTIIQFSGLKSGKYTFDFNLDDNFFSGFENDDIEGGDVNFHVDLEKKERTLCFDFTFNGTIETTCDRCLEKLLVPVEGHQMLCVKLSDSEQSDNEDVLILPENAFKIDLAQWLYEYVVVAMPMQKVHTENECNQEMLQYLEKHDDAKAESTEDIDPRWEALLKLKK